MKKYIFRTLLYSKLSIKIEEAQRDANEERRICSEVLSTRPTKTKKKAPSTLKLDILPDYSTETELLGSKDFS